MEKMTTQTPQQNALAKPKRELRDWLQSDEFRGQLSSILPKGLTAERFVRIAFQSTFRNPKLLQCSQESFFNCLLELAAMGLEPDGRNAHLIPFGQVCTKIVDYKGIAQVLRRNKDVISLHCDVVYTRDEYEAEQGTNQHLRHVKYRGAEGRGSPILAYSFVRLPDGSQEFEEMTVGEVESVRKRSRTPNEGPWVTDWDQMARKTVFRRHSKTLPLSPESRDALAGELDGDMMPVTEVAPFKSASVLPEAPRRRGRPPKQMVSKANYVESLQPPTSPQQQSAQLAGAEVQAQARAQEPMTSPHDVGADEPTKEQAPPLHEQVRELVLDAGFTEAQMLAAMVTRKMAEPEFKSLAECAEHHLLMCIEEWPAALDLLQKFTAASNQQPPANDQKLL
jgi:recombination protein RecT